MTDRILTIHLNLEEGNLLLEALAECSFKSVFELIGKLNQQANQLFISGTAQNERPYQRKLKKTFIGGWRITQPCHQAAILQGIPIRNDCIAR